MPVQLPSYTPPPYLHPGANIVVFLAESGSVRATVLRHLPFTTYQVVLCELASKQSAPTFCLCPGSRFILKIFDPRYAPRFRSDAPQWSHASEREAYSRHYGQLTRECYGANPEHYSIENWEEFFFLVCKTSQMCEVESYRCLTPLQGTAVPRFYGHGTLDMSKIDPARTLNPPAILIEYIEDALPLDQVDARAIDPAVVGSFVQAVARMGPELGVSNNDLNSGNYLFAPGHKPTRILLIDWSHAGVRRPEHTEEEWEYNLENNGALRWTKKCLARKFEHSGLPIPAACADWRSTSG